LSHSFFLLLIDTSLIDMSPVITLTLNPTIDKNARVDRVVAEDKLRCDAPSREPGGGGLNVSRAIDRLGGTTRALYTSGGYTGKMLHDLLDEEGLEQTPLGIEAETRENLIVYETSTDRQFRFGMPGPDLSDTELEACLEALRGLDPAPDYLVASGSLPPGVPDDTYAEVAEVAHDLGARPVLDTSGPALREAMGAGWYLLKPNLRELEHLAGTSLDTEPQRIDAARTFIDRGWCEVLVLSMGASGALLITADWAEHVRSPTVSINSRVGAGDSMVGGLVLALTRGLDLADAVRFGVAAGAAAVTTPGTELCRRDDTEALFERMTDSS
jgi:6-phosphofructokinase 2